MSDAGPDTELTDEESVGDSMLPNESLPTPNQPSPTEVIVSRIARRRRRLAASLGAVPKTPGEVLNWLKITENFVAVSVVLLVPVVIAAVTVASNTYAELSFLLFPPLASGAYTLFSNPDERYRSASNFIRGTTIGGLCGWSANVLIGGSPGGVDPLAAGLAMFLVGVVTWITRLQTPSAFATALLVLTTTEASAVAYVTSVAAGSAIVAGVFIAWHEGVYKRRTQFLYGTLSTADHVAIPVTSATDPAIPLGAALAAAHDAGRVVIVGILEDRDGDEGENSEQAAIQLGETLSRTADGLAEQHGLPCEAAVAAGDERTAIADAVQRTNSDLIVASGSPEDATRIETALGLPTDTVALRSHGETGAWRRVVVMIARPGDIARAMLDFAARISAASHSESSRYSTRVTACTCIRAESERRVAERLLASLVTTVDHPVETRISRDNHTEFVADNDDIYDLALFGAPHRLDDPARFITGEGADQLGSLGCDVAVVDRNDSQGHNRRG